MNLSYRCKVDEHDRCTQRGLAWVTDPPRYVDCECGCHTPSMSGTTQPQVSTGYHVSEAAKARQLFVNHLLYLIVECDLREDMMHALESYDVSKRNG